MTEKRYLCPECAFETGVAIPKFPCKHMLKDDDYTLVDGAAWFTVGGLSVRIRSFEGGAAVSIYHLGQEDEDCISSCMAMASEKETKSLSHYAVLYWDLSSKAADPPLVFLCQAEDSQHAEEQCLDAYPDCRIAWVTFGATTADAAYADYFGSSLNA